MPHSIKKKKKKKKTDTSLPLKVMLEEILKSESKEVSGARDEKILKTLLQCLLS